MKLTFKTQDLPDASWINFAKFLGWQEQILTTDLSPNVFIDNPQTYKDFVISRYSDSIYKDLTAFNIKVAGNAFEWSFYEVHISCVGVAGTRHVGGCPHRYSSAWTDQES